MSIVPESYATKRSRSARSLRSPLRDHPGHASVEEGFSAELAHECSVAKKEGLGFVNSLLHQA